VTPLAAIETGLDYLEPLSAFLAEEDAPPRYIFPELLPCGVLLLIHGDPRARKTMAAAELALSAATGTAPFGLPRFEPAEAVNVWYVQEEDPRALTRPRLRALVRERCGDGRAPETFHVTVRRGVDLDDRFWVDGIIERIRAFDVKLLILDAARRLSAKCDEGPGKTRELIAVLRSIITATGASIAVVHHDVKPALNGQDQRRRGHRASGGDWFAAAECPVHVERTGEHESLVFPQDYKFGRDPAPFTFRLVVRDDLVIRLVGEDTSADHAERAGVRGKVLDWLRVNGPASKTAMKKAGLGQWHPIETAVDALTKEGKLDAGPGRKTGSLLYFVPGATVLDGSRNGAPHGA
jgi:hypothetical protein